MSNSKFAQFDWSQFFHTLSASQMLTFEDCPRKWWLGKIHRLPELTKDHFDFGSAFHECMERWLLADDAGRDANGNPVDMFPKDWDAALSRKDAALVRVLANAAIGCGMVTRLPNRQVEKPFFFKVCDTEHGAAGLVGFMDVASVVGAVLRVEDHKTTSNFKWARSGSRKSVKYLGADAQMLVGAAVLLREWINNGGRGAEVKRIELRHNVVLKNANAPKTKPVDAVVSVTEVQDFWIGRLVPAARDMVALKAAKLPADDWEKVPGPIAKDACSKYGGCPYATICTNRETPDAYRGRITRMNSVELKTPKQDDAMSQVDSIFSDLAAMDGTPAAPAATAPAATAPAATAPAATAPAATAPAVETKQPEASAEPAPEPEPASEAAPESAPVQAAQAEASTIPWANPSCFICKGSGFNAKKGTPCKSCDKAAPAGSKSSDFVLTSGDGVIIVADKAGAEIARVEVIGAVSAVAEKVAEKPPVADKVAASEPVKAPVTSEEAPSTEAADEPTEAEDAKGRGRPRKGFLLARVQSVNVKGRTPAVVDGLDLFRQCAAAIAQRAGVENYYAMPTFGRGGDVGRRDALAVLASRITDQIPGGAIVVARNSEDPDVGAFYVALEMNDNCAGRIS